MTLINALVANNCTKVAAAADPPHHKASFLPPKSGALDGMCFLFYFVVSPSSFLSARFIGMFNSFVRGSSADGGEINTFIEEF